MNTDLALISANERVATITAAQFLLCVKHDIIKSAIMLPNTKHITASEDLLAIRHAMNDVLAFHGSRQILTAQLAQQHDSQPAMLAVEHSRLKNFKSRLFYFQNQSKRFLLHDLTDENGNQFTPHLRQTQYLESQLVCHAWAALHKGHVVGLICYPNLEQLPRHHPEFDRYKSLARSALQRIGYVVSCDLVINSNGQLECYHIYPNYQHKYRMIPYFTRILPLTQHLSLQPISKVRLQQVG